ncbi:MAG TPA: histone deacetylase [Planctomycetota bacterium]|nr:histone deacetylase [Planctomycetota bacterium]
MQEAGIVYSDFYLLHDTGAHPECPARLAAVRDHLVKTGQWERARVFEPRAADVEDLLMVHTSEHVFRVQRFCSEGQRHLDPDTVVCAASFDVARAAAGGVFVGVDQVMLREVTHALCLVRPPGHHASADRAMGFCLFNNVALGARYAQRRHECGKVLIVDFDVHHGNGTESIFYEDDTVYYYSIHRWPFYPGTGSADRRGRGRGEGFTRNVPLSARLDRGGVVSLFVKTLDEIASTFKPDIVFISAGFDAYEGDPIAGLGLVPKDFYEMTRAVVEVTDAACPGRLVSVLEGGYDLDAIGPCVSEHLRALAGE